jgi:hypothetical protein
MDRFYRPHPRELLPAAEREAMDAEYIAYEIERRNRIAAERERADRIARTAHHFSLDGAMSRIEARDERSFQEIHGCDPEFPRQALPPASPAPGCEWSSPTGPGRTLTADAGMPVPSVSPPASTCPRPIPKTRPGAF